LISLNQLNSLHTNTIPGIQQEIRNAQASIEVSYNNRDGNSIIRGLTELEELRIQEQEHKNVSVFATRIALEYTALLSAANQKIVVLRANTAPLVQ
jgi:hypothetical protein